MDDKTLTALRQSIENWEWNAVTETPENYTTGVKDCALCEAFLRDECLGCPVRKLVGGVFCLGSPYYNAVQVRGEWSCDPSNPALRDAAHTAARAEAEFLRSLLPEEEATP